MRSAACAISGPRSAGAPTFGDGDRDAGLDEATGKIGVEARPMAGLLLYANASRGA
ncbi:MAG: hypothetical protein PGN09_05915 [Sphingomonas fennica]